MGISIMNMLPAAPATAGKPGTQPSPGGADQTPGGDSFKGLLASLGAARAGGSSFQPKAEPDTDAGRTLVDNLERIISALSGGNARLFAPGLGLTKAQRAQLLRNLQDILKEQDQNGAQLLAGLLAASHLARLEPVDLSTLSRFFGTSAQGEVSIGAVAANLQLLAQAVQLLDGSDGSLTLLQAVQELTPPGDAFAGQLAACMDGGPAQHATVDPLSIDTGPPRAPNSGSEPRGQAEGAQVPAAAGSDGRESTVTPNGVASPADGAAAGQAESAGSSDVTELANALEELLRTQPGRTAAGGEGSKPKADSAPAAAPGLLQQPAGADGQVPSSLVPEASGSPETFAVGSPLAGNPAGGSTPDHGTPASQMSAIASAGLGAVQAQVATPDSPAAGGDSGPSAAAVFVAQAQDDSQTGGDGQSNQERGSNLSANTDGRLAPALTAPAMPVQSSSAFSTALQTSAAILSGPRTAVAQAVIDQVVQSAVLAIRDGQQEFRLQLKPDFLGALEVRVSMDNGLVSVHMSVDSASTKQLLDNNLAQLRQAFGTVQIRVDQVPSFSSTGGAPAFGQGGQQGYWQGQNPQQGFGRLPDAVPFQFDGDAGSEVVDQPPLAATPAPLVPGGIDLSV